MKKIFWISSFVLMLALGIFIKASTPSIFSFEKVKASHRSSDLILMDRDGRLLHQWRTDSQKRDFTWVDLKNISPAVVPALLKSEDKLFFHHSGVDARAMVASFYQRLFKNSSRGASTLSMQVVKLARPDSRWRGLLGKIRQGLAAWELERHWTKEEILEGYLNLAPFRGEYRGLATISWALFDKSPSGLTQKEATLLAVLLRSPNASEKEWAQRACWQEPSLCADFSRVISSSLLKLGNFSKEGQKALHLAQRLAQDHHAGLLQTSIHLDLQNFVQETVEAQIHNLKEQNVHDAAVLVIENETGEVWAYVGGSGPLASAHYVDGIQASRQAGSTLKPFLYATAFEKDILKPDSWIEDSAVDIVFDRGVYKPQNHDHLFYGWVRAKTALGSSLNVPAVKVFKLLNDNAFWEKLQMLHFKSLQDPDFYGPALALGVADINLEDLTQAYRTLARGGLWSPLKFTNENPKQISSERIFTAEISEVMTRILASKENRALGFGMDSTLSLTSDAAVKTGTSKDMRDNWCVGYNSRFTVGVWVGNFSGQPMWNVMGITGAGPIWNQVMSWLQEKYPTPGFHLHLANEKSESRPKAYPKVRILYPQDGMILAVDPAIPLINQKMPLLVEGEQKKKFSWRINGKKRVSAKEPYLWTPTPGHHTFELLSGNTATQKVQVIVK